MRTNLAYIPENLPFLEVSYARPFVKWVGGKKQLLPELIKRLPPTFKNYYEPFLGGGALFFRIQPQRAYLSDVNEELVNAYQVVRSDVSALIRNLGMHRYERDYFYELREADRRPSFKRWSAVRRASRLIYLNKTCFNGLFRVNSQGQFNAPFGRYTNPTIVDADNLRACSAVLQQAVVRRAGFENIEKRITKRDFVYFDPPYVPLSPTANFTSYSKHGFDEDMQQRLFELCCRLDRRGVRFMLSNSSAPSVLRMYKKFRLEKILAGRAVNSKGSARGKIAEVIVRNY